MARNNGRAAQEVGEWLERVFGEPVLSSDKKVCARAVCYKGPNMDFYGIPHIAFQVVYEVLEDGTPRVGRNVGLSYDFRLELSENDNRKWNYLLDKQAEAFEWYSKQRLPASTKGKKGQPAPNTESPVIAAKFEELAKAGKITTDQVMAVALGQMTKEAAVMALLTTV